MISQHFKKDMENGLEKHFEGNNCTLCGSLLGTKAAIKKHLIITHKYFDELISKDFDLVLANKTKSLFGSGLKRKRVQCNNPFLKQNSKMPKSDLSLDHIDEERLKEDDSISYIKSRIEFSDSESEDDN